MADRNALIADRLRQEMESWRSIEIRATTDQPLPTNPPLDMKVLFLRSEQHYIETAVGQRRLDRTMKFSDGSAQREQGFSDGLRYANVAFDPSGARQSTIGIANHFLYEDKMGFTERPEPLYFFHVGKRPIYEAIRTAEPLGEGRVLGRGCDLYLFRKVKLSAAPLDALYYLDRETSLPLKVEFYRAGSDRLPGSALRAWEAKTFDTVEEGHHFPLSSANTYFTGRVGNSSNIVTITEIHYNRDYAASTFWPTFQPGVEVYDYIKKTSTKVPDPAAPPTAQKPPAAGTPTAVAPVKPPITATPAVAAPAVPPWSWGSIGSSASLGLGVLLIAAAIVVGRRRGR